MQVRVTQQAGGRFCSCPDYERPDWLAQKCFHDAMEVERREMRNLGQRFQINLFSKMEVDVIYYCIYAFLILFTRGLLAMFHKFFFEFHDAKIRVNRIGDLSKVAINSISFDKIR